MSTSFLNLGSALTDSIFNNSKSSFKNFWADQGLDSLEKVIKEHSDVVTLLKIKDEYLPFLSETTTLEKFPYVQVDMGAVKFMCKGANLMRPGIKKFTEFSKDDIVCIVEESQNKFLAVGKSLVNSSELDNMDKGEILKNLHYISDKAWEISKTL